MAKAFAPCLSKRFGHAVGLGFSVQDLGLRVFALGLNV